MKWSVKVEATGSSLLLTPENDNEAAALMAAFPIGARLAVHDRGEGAMEISAGKVERHQSPESCTKDGFDRLIETADRDKYKRYGVAPTDGR